MPHFPQEISYSDKYQDGFYEYRTVVLPKNLYKQLPKNKLLSQFEWRKLGVQGSDGWVHYDFYKPEPHILMLRKALR